MPNRPLTVLFMPESAYGPTNNCIGIGDVLRREGHRVVFAAEASWRGPARGRSASRRISSTWRRRSDRARDAEDAGQFWKDFIRDTAPEFRKPTIEQLATFMQPTWQALIDGRDVLRAAAARDHRRGCARRHRRGQRHRVPGADDRRRAVRAHRRRATRWRSRAAADPAGVLRAARGRPAPTGTAFRAEYDRTHRPTWAGRSTTGCRSRAPRRCRTSSSCTPRDHLNLYIYPAGRRLHRPPPARRDMAPARLQRPRRPMRPSSCRRSSRTAGGGAGLPVARVARLAPTSSLMRRLVDVLGHARIATSSRRARGTTRSTLPDNMWGAEFVPQTSVLPQVDLVITHGGNNTTTESLPLRQADGRCCRCSGTSTTTPSGSTRSASASGWTPTASPTPSCSARSTACSATTTCGGG